MTDNNQLAALVVAAIEILEDLADSVQELAARQVNADRVAEAVEARLAPQLTPSRRAARARRSR